MSFFSLKILNFRIHLRKKQTNLDNDDVRKFYQNHNKLVKNFQKNVCFSLWKSSIFLLFFQKVELISTLMMNKIFFKIIKKNVWNDWKNNRCPRVTSKLQDKWNPQQKGDLIEICGNQSPSDSTKIELFLMRFKSWKSEKIVLIFGLFLNSKYRRYSHFFIQIMRKTWFLVKGYPFELEIYNNISNHNLE